MNLERTYILHVKQQLLVYFISDQNNFSAIYDWKFVCFAVDDVCIMNGYSAFSTSYRVMWIKLETPRQLTKAKTIIR